MSATSWTIPKLALILKDKLPIFILIMSPRRQAQTRISSRKSLLEKKAPQYAAPPVMQPKLQRKTERELPEWKPESSRKPSPLERLGHSGTQAKPELRGSQAIVQRTLEEVESSLDSGKTKDGVESFTSSSTGSSGGDAIVQRTLDHVEARLGPGKTLGGLEAYCRTIEFSPENVGFLRACRVWRGLGRGANIAAQTKIYNKYIVSYGCINIAYDPTRRDLVARQQQSVTSGVPDVTIFDAAEKEVTRLLVNDVVPRYNKQAEDTKVG